MPRPTVRLARAALCVAFLLALLPACNVVSEAPSSVVGDDVADRPNDSDLTSVGPDGQMRIYYQFVDARHQVRFVERLEDVPEQWRERVGFVELAGPPPMTPADARRATAASGGPSGGVPPSSIILYSADWCGYCRQAKRDLNQRGIPYALRDVDVPAAKAELLAKTGGKGIPALDVDGRMLRGYSSASYADFLRSVGL